jgi:hypothetical protein
MFTDRNFAWIRHFGSKLEFSWERSLSNANAVRVGGFYLEIAILHLCMEVLGKAFSALINNELVPRSKSGTWQLCEISEDESVG